LLMHQLPRVVKQKRSSQGQPPWMHPDLQLEA